jgi:hypothetical protein
MTLERPVVVPLMPRFRFRVEVCAVLTPTGLAVIARDVLEALELPFGAYEDEPTHAVSFAEHATATTWNRDTIASILAVVDERPDVAEFLTWLDARIDEMNAWGVENVNHTIASPSTPGETETGTWFSVVEAAHILDRDPTISIGSLALLEWLHLHGWISRTQQSAWMPTPQSLGVGNLIGLDHRIPGRADLYPQVCITTAGMHALHARLGGTATLNLRTITDTPLLED